MTLTTLLKATGCHCRFLASGDVDAQTTHLPPSIQGCSESAGCFWSPSAAPWGRSFCVIFHGTSSLISVSFFQHPAWEAE